MAPLNAFSKQHLRLSSSRVKEPHLKLFTPNVTRAGGHQFNYHAEEQVIPFVYKQSSERQARVLCRLFVSRTF